MSTVPDDVRAGVLARARGACERCSGPLDGWSGYSVHHRRAKGMGGSRLADTDTAVNLAVLCGTGTVGCHALVHQFPGAYGRPEGWVVPSWQDPAEVAVLWHGHERRTLTDTYDYGAAA